MAARMGAQSFDNDGASDAKPADDDEDAPPFSPPIPFPPSSPPFQQLSPPSSPLRPASDDGDFIVADIDED